MGVLTAPATCTGPESIETIKSHIAISATSSSPLSRPATDFTPVRLPYSEDPSALLIPNWMITASYSEWILFISCCQLETSHSFTRQLGPGLMPISKPCLVVLESNPYVM